MAATRVAPAPPALPPAPAAASHPLMLAASRRGLGGGRSGGSGAGGSSFAASASTYSLLRRERQRGSFAASVKALSSPRLDAEQQRRARLMRPWRRRLLIAACVLAAAGMASGIAAAQLVFWRCQLDPDLGSCPARVRDASTDALKAVTTATTVALVLVLVVLGVADVEDLRLSGELLPHETALATPVPLRTALSAFLCAVHCPAGVYVTTRVVSQSNDTIYDYDSLLAIALAFRGFVLFPLVIGEFAGLRTPAARVIERFQGVRVDLGYTMRLLMERAPLTVSFVSFLAVLSAFAYAAHVAERPVCQGADAAVSQWCGSPTMGTRDFSSFANSLWSSIITALTVGYGDIVPVTQLGRAAASFTALCGTILLAILISATARSTTLSPAEMRAARAFLRIRQHDERRRVAGRVVGRFVAVSRMRLPSKGGAAAAAAPPPPPPPDADSDWHSARRRAEIARLRPLSAVPEALRHALASAVHEWKAQLRTMQRINNDVDDVAKLHHDVLDLRETTDKNFRRLETQLSRQIARLEAAVALAAGSAAKGAMPPLRGPEGDSSTAASQEGQA